jgi:hypothetical protein
MDAMDQCDCVPLLLKPTIGLEVNLIVENNLKILVYYIFQI